MKIKSKLKNTPQGLKTTFRALRYRNYRLFFIGQNISLIGTWMQSVAVSWLVYRLTDSAFLLGIVGFSSQIPAFLLSSLGGVATDRYDRHKILLVTQILAMLQALILAFLVLTDFVGFSVWHIIILNIFLGLINAFDIPARQSLAIQIIDNKEDLSNAIALNSSMFNASRLIGPSLAGILIALFGEGICFLINALSYVAIISSVLAMKINSKVAKKTNSKVFHELKEGFSYAFHFKEIRILILLLALVSFIGMPYIVLMPVFAKNILQGGPQTLGFLMSAVGFGALSGALFLASRKTIFGLEKKITFATFIFTTGLIAFSFSKILLVSLVLLYFVGFGMMVLMAGNNTILQTIVADDKRGRVMSLHTMAFMGMLPFGGLISGSVADLIGASETLRINGILCLFGAIYFAPKVLKLSEIIKPKPSQVPVILEVAEGIGTTTELSIPPER
ncbi:MFS transporter [bacterium]|nr:MFS transporter [bacterium]